MPDYVNFADLMRRGLDVTLSLGYVDPAAGAQVERADGDDQQLTPIALQGRFVMSLGGFAALHREVLRLASQLEAEGFDIKSLHFEETDS